MITGHTRPDGDCVGSCMGLYHFIREQYPEIQVDVRLEEIPASYRLIPGTEAVISTYDDDKVYDLVITSDASDRSRLADFDKFFVSAKHRICIDHHISNKGFADENLVIPGASSASEIVADLIGMDRISYNAAFALYTGIICDSGVFKYSSTSKHTMEIAGGLMEKGIPYTSLIDDVFYRKTFLQNKLLGVCLGLCKQALDGKVITCLVEQKVLTAMGAGHDDLEGVIDQMRVTQDAEVAILAHENPDGKWKYSMRSNKIVDVAAIAGTFGGGGHVRAAGCTIENGPEALPKIIEMIKEQL